MEAKILVSVCSYYDVFQCRSDPDVYHNEKLKFDEHILGVRDPTIIQPFNIILVKTYVESLPRALQEAAEIDGAGIFKIFYKIILPTCTPI